MEKDYTLISKDKLPTGTGLCIIQLKATDYVTFQHKEYVRKNYKEFYCWWELPSPVKRTEQQHKKENEKSKESVSTKIKK